MKSFDTKWRCTLFSSLALVVLPSLSIADFNTLTLECPPVALEAKVKAKAYEWKNEIEKRWCTQERSSRYVIVIHCSKAEGDLPHTTTFHFAGPGLIDRANVDIDPSSPEVLNRGLPHGLVHAILPGCLPKQIGVFDLPAWALEGTAQSLVPSLDEDAQRLWGSKLSAETIQPLARFLFTEARSLAFYTQAGLFVRFLVSQGGPANFKGFLLDLGIEETGSALSLAHHAQYERTFQKRYGMGTAALDAAFQKYLEGVLHPAVAK